jgi:hypothetical protein
LFRNGSGLVLVPSQQIFIVSRNPQQKRTESGQPVTKACRSCWFLTVWRQQLLDVSCHQQLDITTAAGNHKWKQQARKHKLKDILMTSAASFV